MNQSNICAGYASVEPSERKGEMTSETFKFLVLGLPGIICYFLCQKLIGKPKRTTINTILLIFLYSILSYLLLSIFHAQVNCIAGNGFNSDIIDVFTDGQKNITAVILVFASLSGVILAYLLSYLNHKTIVNRIGWKLKATRRFGDVDVWHYFHNSEFWKTEDWVFIRDLKANLTYYCSITVWSDSGELRELVLNDVSVYTSDTGEHLYDTQHMYLSRNSDDLVIEIPPADAETIDIYKLSSKKGEKNEQ